MQSGMILLIIYSSPLISSVSFDLKLRVAVYIIDEYEQTSLRPGSTYCVSLRGGVVIGGRWSLIIRYCRDTKFRDGPIISSASYCYAIQALACFLCLLHRKTKESVGDDHE